MNQYIIGQPQITYGKEVYRRFTEHVAYKENFKVESNFITFNFKDSNDLDIINNIWISNYDSVNKINFLLVPKYTTQKNNINQNVDILELYHNKQKPPKYIDPCEIEELEYPEYENIYNQDDFNNKINQLEQENQVNQNNKNNDNNEDNIDKNYINIDENTTIESLLEIPETFLINSVSIDVLLFMQSFTINDLKNNYLEIPVSRSAYMLQLIDNSNYKLVLHFDKKDKNPINLTVKMLKLTSEDEKRRFKNNHHEYLIKRYIDISHNLKPNDKIVPNFINTSINTIVIKSPKKLNSIKIGNNEFVNSRDNPENIYVSDNYYYFLDMVNEYNGFTKNYQPSSHYSFGPYDTINITHDFDEEVPIVISYFLYDVLRYLYDKKIYYLTYKYIHEQKFNNYVNNLVEKLLETEKLLLEDEFNNLTKDIIFKQNHFNMIFEENINDNDINNMIFRHDKTEYEKYKDKFNIKYPPKIIQPEENDEDNQEPIHEQIDFVDRYKINNTNKTQRILNLYFPYIKKFIEQIEKDNAINKLLSDDVVCEITLDSIGIGEYYYSCFNCNGHFESSAYKYWIEEPARTSSCPKCKEKIDEISQLYCNQ